MSENYYPEYIRDEGQLLCKARQFDLDFMPGGSFSTMPNELLRSHVGVLNVWWGLDSCEAYFSLWVRRIADSR